MSNPHPIRSLGAALLVALFGACASGGGGGDGGDFAAFDQMRITQDMLAEVQPMSIYDFLRRHSRVRIERVSANDPNAGGSGEAIFVEGRAGLTAGDRVTTAAVFVDDRQVFDPIATVREMRTNQIQRLEILRAGEASGRFGGSGYSGAISISTGR